MPKYNAETIEEITSITRSVLFSGKVVPTCHFRNNQRITLQSEGRLRELELGVGSRAVVSNGVFLRSADGICRYGRTPIVCPSCNAILLHTSCEKGSLYCQNLLCRDMCAPHLWNYVQTHKIPELSFTTIAKLCRLKSLRLLGDIYRLTVPVLTETGLSDLRSLAVLAKIHGVDISRVSSIDRISQLICQEIFVKKKIPQSLFLVSLGIYGITTEIARHIEKRQSFDTLRMMTIDELNSIVSKDIARAIYFYMKQNKESLSDLLTFVEPVSPKERFI